jgi:methylated-DNA-[protein]-cysteine S-methyltransferase
MMTTMTSTNTYKPTRSSQTTPAQAFSGVPLAAQAVLDSPIGPMLALATAKGIAGLWFDGQKHHPGEFEVPVDATHAHIAALRTWLDDYWAARDPSWERVPLDLHGSAFQRAVWKALLTIALGRTKSYGEIAAQVGGGAMPRATGTAVGRNPVSILVPCHRVIGANGSLTGYAGGLQRKERLLQHEGVLLA